MIAYCIVHSGFVKINFFCLNVYVSTELFVITLLHGSEINVLRDNCNTKVLCKRVQCMQNKYYFLWTITAT